MWKSDVEEMYPYCAVSFIAHETITKTDLSAYRCFGWSQLRIAVPRTVSLKILKKAVKRDVSVPAQNFRVYYVYTLFI
jgi:hypothetical protein